MAIAFLELSLGCYMEVRMHGTLRAGAAAHLEKEGTILDGILEVSPDDGNTFATFFKCHVRYMSVVFVLYVLCCLVKLNLLCVVLLKLGSVTTLFSKQMNMHFVN